MTNFWSDFWPNLAATIGGIAIGVPLALWINRHAAALGERQRIAAERAQAVNVLQVIELAIAENRTRIQRFAAVLAQSKTLFDTGLDTSAWDAVQASLTSVFNDPRLRQRLAYHFARLGGVVKLNDLFVRFAVGVESAMSGAAPAKAALATALATAVAELDSEAPGLIEAIATTRAALASNSDSQALAA